MRLKEKYGEYIYLHHRPDVIDRATWREYNDKTQKMCVWCNEQKFDHWGIVEGNNALFWFSVEADYIMFLLRWT